MAKEKKDNVTKLEKRRQPEKGYQHMNAPEIQQYVQDVISGKAEIPASMKTVNNLLKDKNMEVQQLNQRSMQIANQIESLKAQGDELNNRINQASGSIDALTTVLVKAEDERRFAESRKTKPPEPEKE